MLIRKGVLNDNKYEIVGRAAFDYETSSTLT